MAVPFDAFATTRKDGPPDEPRDDHGRWTAGGGETYFHGTSEPAAEHIAVEGLKPSNLTLRNWAISRPGVVYFAHSRHAAQGYAEEARHHYLDQMGESGRERRDAAKTLGYAIVEVKLPEATLRLDRNFVGDLGTYEHDLVEHAGLVPPSAITKITVYEPNDKGECCPKVRELAVHKDVAAESTVYLPVLWFGDDDLMRRLGYAGKDLWSQAVWKEFSYKVSRTTHDRVTAKFRNRVQWGLSEMRAVILKSQCVAAERRPVAHFNTLHLLEVRA